MSYYLIPLEWPPSKKSTKDKCWRGCTSPSTVDGNVYWYSHYREQYGDSLKTQNRTTVWSSNPTPGHILEETIIQNGACAPCPLLIVLFTIARTRKQAKCPLPEEWIKKVWNVYTMEYCSAIERNDIVPFCKAVNEPRDYHTAWSKPEREKQILSYSTYMWNLEKWYRRTCLQSRNRDTDTENKHMDTKLRGWGTNRMNWEIRIDIYVLLYIKQITNENLEYSTGNSTPRSAVT